jgi:DNA-binding XRE family transcriptional regulator
MSQTQYAAFIGLSAKTLRAIEKVNTDPKLSVLSKVFRPAGMNVIAQAK